MMNNLPSVQSTVSGEFVGSAERSLAAGERAVERLLAGMNAKMSCGIAKEE